MNYLRNLKKLLILTVFGILVSCASSKNMMVQADDIFDAVTQHMEAIQEADKSKFMKIEQYLKTAKKTQIQAPLFENAQELLKTTKSRQLNLEKMTSGEIDKYDASTKELLGQLEKIQQADSKNEVLKKQLDEIQEIDNQDLARRVRYDRAVMAWNKLFKKSKKKLQKLKKYAQAQPLPVFTIPK